MPFYHIGTGCGKSVKVICFMHQKDFLLVRPADVKFRLDVGESVHDRFLISEPFTV